MRTSKRTGCDLLLGLRSVSPGRVRELRRDCGPQGRALLQRLRSVAGGLTLVTGVVFALAADATPAFADTVRGVARACDVPSDTTSELGKLWHSVRLTLLDARTADGQSEIALFERTVSRDGKKVKDATSRNATLPARRPFSSRTLGEIESGGYLVDTAEESAYYAPDADILLSDGFLKTHCFSVAKASKDAPQLIGLAFRPERERPNVSDIEGTFWIDPALQGPVRLEFRYTSVSPAFRSARVGGELLFARVEGAQWLLSGWEIRMPLGVVNSRKVMSDAGGTRTQKLYTIDELKSFGGTVKTYVEGSKSVTLPTR